MEVSIRIVNWGSVKFCFRAPSLPRSPRIALSPLHCNFSARSLSQLGFLQQPLSASRASDCSSAPTGFDTLGSDAEPEVMVVLLGWLGSKPENLNRFVKLYRSRGIRSVVFVVSMSELLSLDLGTALQERIGSFARELGRWVGETQRDGRERFLLFHTFSNTGWLVYGKILDSLQGRQDLLMRIKGCIIDSGGDPDLNPKVWAAGFTAALLKKRSSANHSTEVGRGIESEVRLSRTLQEPSMIETVLRFVLEMLLCFLSNLPVVNERLTRVVSTLSSKQPPCPQLYLYSTADRVIPWKSIELFIKQQRRTGRIAQSFNFGDSPHVEHYRSYPTIYITQIMNFLQDCSNAVKIL